MSGEPDNRFSVVSLMAHPDDAEFLCGGTLVRLADLGWQVHIVSATAGECGTLTESAETTAARRFAEATEAASLIGATFTCLGEPDGMLMYDRPTLTKVIDLFRRLVPCLVLTTARDDYHVDHETISKLARAASFLYGAKNISPVPLRPGSKVPHLYYADPIDGVDSIGKPVVPTTYVDVSNKLEQKVRMLSCHLSQIEWVETYHGTGEFVLAMERLARQRGSEIGVGAAEGYIQHRGHAFPSPDLLNDLLAVASS